MTHGSIMISRSFDSVIRLASPVMKGVKWGFAGRRCVEARTAVEQISPTAIQRQWIE